MGVYEDCRHFLRRSTAGGETLTRCRIEVNEKDPFACPVDCLFKETRVLADAGWAQAPTAPMSNTADALAAMPPPKRRKPKKRR